MHARWVVPLTCWALLLGCGRTEPLTSRKPILLDGSVTTCSLEVGPSSVDLGSVPAGTQASSNIELRNVSLAPCDITSLAIADGSDSEFLLVYPPLTPFTLEAGEVKHVSVGFDARSRDLPRERLGTVVVQSDDPDRVLQTVSLQARILVGCDLKVAPDLVDFGTVRLNTSAASAVTLTNGGDAPCELTNVAIAPGSSPLFSIPSDQPRAFQVAPGSALLRVAFSADDSGEPHSRTGTLSFRRTQPSGLPVTPSEDLQVPLQAFIDTQCVAGSQWIYTVDDAGTLATFNPTSLEFTNIATLRCPSWGTPFSMAVDQKAIAWVEYSDGNLFRVDTRTGSCSPTSFLSDWAFTSFGMGFVYDPDSAVDTLFIAGTSNPTVLATISFPSLSIRHVGEISLSSPELTGTGDGQLWAFSPLYGFSSVAYLARIDPKDGAVLARYQYPEISRAPSNWAVSFWGGSFWIFLNDTIWEVPRSTLQARLAVSKVPRHVVGVGTSTCAPLD